MKNKIIIIFFVCIFSFLFIKSILPKKNELSLGDTNTLIGDVNGDGKVSAVDYILIRKHILNNPKLVGDELKRADVNKDGKVSALDYIAIRKIILSGHNLVETNTPIPTTKPTTTPMPTIKPTAKPTPTIKPSLSLNKKSLTMKSGNKEQLKATISPSNSNITITWSTSDKNVATVDSNGNVKAVKSGIATITAKASNGLISNCEITVERIKILFVGNSKTFYNMYREFTINIATNKGYYFTGKQPKAALTQYNNSGNKYYNVNVDNTDNIDKSYYSFTKGSTSLSEHLTRINETQKYRDAFANLKIDYLILQERSLHKSNGTTLSKEDFEKGLENGVRGFINLLKNNNPDLKIYIRNVWQIDTKDNTYDISKNAVNNLVKKLSKEGINIKVINDGDVIYNAVSKGYKMFIDIRHQNYLAAYAAALSINKVLFNIDPTTVTYVPNVLKTQDLDSLAGNTFKYYLSPYKNDTEKIKQAILEEQKHVEDIKKLVKSIIK